ncbi:hypothetical protein MPC4_280035 [Methylocella tundrae]|uniref:Uncharacterized protein n=1 Tax=Methylocella tundrae TaxID=227605 RepID=A0A8B6M7L0_METTU|nr:hypothetical protein MPC1_3350004 [Methylocella tundrae]VTZ50738.1 hypothetical protein MPC4_280035 [Methylocella tundrae]
MADTRELTTAAPFSLFRFPLPGLRLQMGGGREDGFRFAETYRKRLLYMIPGATAPQACHGFVEGALRPVWP